MVGTLVQSATGVQGLAEASNRDLWHLPVERFVSELAIEAFNTPVLPGTARHGLTGSWLRPFQAISWSAAADELRTVVRSGYVQVLLWPRTAPTDTGADRPTESVCMLLWPGTPYFNHRLW